MLKKNPLLQLEPGDVIRMRYGRGTVLATVHSPTVQGVKVTYTSRRTRQEVGPIEIPPAVFVSIFSRKSPGLNPPSL